MVGCVTLDVVDDPWVVVIMLVEEDGELGGRVVVEDCIVVEDCADDVD